MGSIYDGACNVITESMSSCPFCSLLAPRKEELICEGGMEGENRRLCSKHFGMVMVSTDGIVYVRESPRNVG